MGIKKNTPLWGVSYGNTQQFQIHSRNKKKNRQQPLGDKEKTIQSSPDENNKKTITVPDWALPENAFVFPYLKGNSNNVEHSSLKRYIAPRCSFRLAALAIGESTTKSYNLPEYFS
jgi:hypothetical protein